MPLRKWRGNTRRENRLEELGRVDAEKAYTKKGKRNLKDEKSRIRKELATGGRGMDPKDLQRKLTPPGGYRRKAGPQAARPIPKSLRDRLRDLYKKREGKQSPGRPGGKGPKPDKRLKKGDKFPMAGTYNTQIVSDVIAHHKRGKNPGSLGGRGGKNARKNIIVQKTLNTLLKSGTPKIAKKGWK